MAHHGTRNDLLQIPLNRRLPHFTTVKKPMPETKTKRQDPADEMSYRVDTFFWLLE
jgi:hypothetical protein